MSGLRRPAPSPGVGHPFLDDGADGGRAPGRIDDGGFVSQPVEELLGMRWVFARTTRVIWRGEPVTGSVPTKTRSRYLPGANSRTDPVPLGRRRSVSRLSFELATTENVGTI